MWPMSRDPSEQFHIDNFIVGQLDVSLCNQKDSANLCVKRRRPIGTALSFIMIDYSAMPSCLLSSTILLDKTSHTCLLWNIIFSINALSECDLDQYCIKSNYLTWYHVRLSCLTNTMYIEMRYSCCNLLLFLRLTSVSSFLL